MDPEEEEVKKVERRGGKREGAGRKREHPAELVRAETFYTTPTTRRAIEAWRTQYTAPEFRLKKGKNMSKSDAFRQICLLAEKKIERDRAREAR
ncbi:MAG: hypothetical protein V3T22_10385 [Planctomycetota bacterium]